MSRKVKDRLVQKPNVSVPVGAPVGPPPLKLLRGNAEPILRKDTRLPFFDVAWSHGKMLEFLNREVLPICSVAPAAWLSRERMTYTAGRKCVILCSLHVSDQLQPARWAVVTFARDDSLHEVYLGHYCGNSDHPAGGWVASMPESRCLVEFFPMDWQLPSLPWALDASEMALLLARAGDLHLANAAHGEVEILSYRPHETCVLGYRFGQAVSKVHREVVGKVYRDGDRAETAWRVLKALHAQTANYGVGIPRPLAIEKGRSLVLMERVFGTSMEQLITGARGVDQVKEATRRAAQTLAAYHGLSFEGEPERSFATEVEKLRKREARLHRVAPSLARQVDGLLSLLEHKALRFKSGQPTLIHGDFKPSHLLIEKGRVNVVDFDRSSRGDPAIDVGNFMAQLRKEALSSGQDGWRCLSGYFLAEYQERSRVVGLDYRARVFEAASLIRLAVRKFEESPDSYGRKGIFSDQIQLLDEASSCLSAL